MAYCAACSALSSGRVPETHRTSMTPAVPHSDAGIRCGTGQATEPYMEGVNPFIKSNRLRMIMFLDELGNVPELPDTTERPRTDLPRDLAALHEMCVTYSDDLRTLSNERGAQQHVLKKLLAITELLQQKQNQYSTSNNIR